MLNPNSNHHLEISVVVPTYNRADLLGRTIHALSNQTGGMRYEVIWVDDGSSDETEALLTAATISNPHLLRYIRCERSGGPAMPRNVGIVQARGDIIITLDDDIIPDFDFVLNHWRFHKRQRETNVGAVGELYLSDDDQIQPMSIFASFPYEELRTAQPLDFLHFWAGNMSLKRCFMLEHGMYRVDNELTLLEDMECGYRMMHRGLVLRFCPEARGQHMVSRMTTKAVAAKGYHTGRAQWRLLQLVPEVSVMERFGILSAQLGAAAYLRRLIRRGLFRLTDNRFTAWLLIRMGALSNQRSAVSDFYNRLIFRRNMIAGYCEALNERSPLSTDLVSNSRV